MNRPTLHHLQKSGGALPERMSVAELHALQRGGGTVASRFQALGRLAQGKMNKTEEAYARHLDDRILAGEVLWWSFEALKLRLADNTFLEPDFLVLAASGALEVHDTKGGRGVYTDDARVKMKVAAETFPFTFRVAFPRARRAGGGWDVETVGREVGQ
jgi:hypothetical protein